MNQRAMISVEIKKNERDYVLLMPMGAPIGEAYDVVHEMLQALLKMANDATQRAAPQAAVPSQPIEPEIVQ